MQSNQPDEKFWEIADSFVNLANQHLDHTGQGKVSAAMLYAAARFNSFVVASAAGSIEELKRDQEEALEYFTEQYRKMLRENLADHIEHFEANTKL